MEKKDQLEALLDHYGPGGLLVLLAEICMEKSMHVEANWQDQYLAKVWMRVGKRIEKYGQSIKRIQP